MNLKREWRGYWGQMEGLYAAGVMLKFHHDAGIGALTNVYTNIRWRMIGHMFVAK